MESKQHAIWRNKITGRFLFYQWVEENPQSKKKAKKSKRAEEELEFDEEEEIEQAIEENTKLDEAMEMEVVDEENLLLDVMENYKTKFGVKKVNTNTKKFKDFLEEWKNSD